MNSNSNYTEVVAAWIVAAALVAAVAAHTFLPATPPRLEHGVMAPAAAARAGTPALAPDRDIPLIDSPDGPT